MKRFAHYFVTIMTIILITGIAVTAMAKKITLTSPKGINISNIQFAANGPDNIRDPAVFSPGDNIIITFDVTGYKIVNKTVSIKGDLMITGPSGNVILKEDDTIDYKGPAKKAGKKGVASLTLSKRAPAGDYVVTITVNDLIGNKSIKVHETFSVK